MDAKEKISRRLEPEVWRTTQREDRSNYEQMETAGKWGRILDAIIGYQNRHAGQSPSNTTIASLTGYSPGQIGYHLQEMEERGLITDTKGFPRTLTVVAAKATATPPTPAGVDKVIQEADVITPTEGEATTTRVRRVGFYKRAKQIAQAIVDYQDREGTYPGVREIAQAVYGKTRSGSASQMIKLMVQRGWVHHENRRHADLCMTALGRAALFGEMREPIHTDIPAKPRDRVVDVQPTWPREAVVQPAPAEVVPTPSVRPGLGGPRMGDHFVAPGFRSDGTAMEIRRAAPVAESAPTLDHIGDVDLILALTNRGYKVTR